MKECTILRAVKFIRYNLWLLSYKTNHINVMACTMSAVRKSAGLKVIISNGEKNK